MNIKFASPYDQNPLRISMVTKNKRKKRERKGFLSRSNRHLNLPSVGRPFHPAMVLAVMAPTVPQSQKENLQ